jgi:8-oxo-dGTP diphosphatase
MKRQNTAILFYNQNGEVLLQLRDNNPEIKWSNHWGCLGGAVEEGESVEDCLKREIQEEIEYNLVEYESLGVLGLSEDWGYHMFIGPLNRSVHEISLHEGQEIRFFDPAETLKLDLTLGARELVQKYIEKMNV